MMTGNRYILIKFILLYVIVLVACKATNYPNETIFSDRKFLSIKLLDNKKYEYSYYTLDSTGIKFDFNTGLYKQFSGSLKLFPDTLKADNFEFTFQQSKESLLQGFNRIKISTNILGDELRDYKICLRSDSVNTFFSGISVDTIINSSKLKNLRIEIFIADYFLNPKRTPVVKYKSIQTPTIEFDTSFNSFAIKLPVEYRTFYYKNSVPVLIRDSGAYWFITDTHEKIKKGKRDFK